MKLRLTTGLALIVLLIPLISCSQPPPIKIQLAPQAQAIELDQVSIDGTVNVPGIYQLKPGDTIDSLLRAAGGLTVGANLSAVEIRFISPSSSPQKVDLNHAEVWLLVALPGVGEAKAKAITDYRTQNGLFKSVVELMKVPGFGQATFDAVKNLITVSP